jgi:hypothetical protein
MKTKQGNCLTDLSTVMILQQNIDIVKVEHNVDILNEDDSSDMNSVDVYIQSACSMTKADPEVSHVFRRFL